MNAGSALAVAILSGIALFHALWGFGFSAPAADRVALAHMVIGQARVPPPFACFVVAAGVAAIALAAAVAGRLIAAPPLLVAGARIVCWLAVAVFAARAVAGYLPPFERVFPLEPFHTLNRLIYSPLCALLAALLAVTARIR